MYIEDIDKTFKSILCDYTDNTITFFMEDGSKYVAKNCANSVIDDVHKFISNVSNNYDRVKDIKQIIKLCMNGGGLTSFAGEILKGMRNESNQN